LKFGYQILQLNDEEIGKLYINGIPPIKMFENEFLVLKDSRGKIIDKFKF